MKWSENYNREAVQMRIRGRKRDVAREGKKKKEGCLTVADRGFGERDKVKCSQHFLPVFDSRLNVCCCHRALTTLVTDLSVRSYFCKPSRKAGFYHRSGSSAATLS